MTEAMKVDGRIRLRVGPSRALTINDYDLYQSLAARHQRGASGPSSVTTTGQGLTDDPGYMRGHGTYVLATGSSSKRVAQTDNEDDEEDEDGETRQGPAQVSLIVSSLAGSVERVNRLVTVAPLRSRYVGAIGDLVVGRITDITAKRWKVDCGSRQDASLQLSSINLPGGIQRRKNEADELQMRTFFKEGDLLVAEVQTLHQDGSMHLHTRSLRYGKLRDGLLVRVQPTLISRLKTHFVQLTSCPIMVILGLNGYIWIQMRREGQEEINQEMGGYDDAFEAHAVYSDTNQPFREELFTDLVRVRNVVVALGRANLPVLDTSIDKVYVETFRLDYGLPKTTDESAMSFAVGSALKRRK